MTQKRAGRNRTLTLEPEEIPRLRERLLTPEKLAAGESVINRILYADLFCVLDRIPGKFADLVLADPPYNLNKNFGGERFSAMPPAAENSIGFVMACTIIWNMAARKPAEVPRLIPT